MAHDTVDEVAQQVPSANIPFTGAATVSTPVAGEVAERDERGMTTAEYAMGIIAACTLMGVLILVFSKPEFQQLMAELISNLMRKFLTKG